MSPKGIHIVSFDVPYPADYGGVIDVFHRCKALKESGVKVILHCFEYGRGERKELLEVADEVHYYARKKSLWEVCSATPFIVKTRENKQLLQRLLADNFPILFEGIHTCAYLHHPSLKKRWKGVRAHNVEHDYYRGLAKVEKQFLKKLFFLWEAKKLEKFEKNFNAAQEILTVTPKDNEYYQKNFQKGVYIPVFNPLNWGSETREIGDYALFHGNLSVMENENAVRYIVEQIWEKDTPLKLYIAGKNPPATLTQFLNSQDYEIKCIPNPSDEELNRLIKNAKINLLPTFQDTGIKHKLLNCLANGGFCLANDDMVRGTGLGKFCIIVNSVTEWKEKIKEIGQTKEEDDLFIERKKELRRLFNLQENALRIRALAGID